MQRSVSIRFGFTKKSQRAVGIASPPFDEERINLHPNNIPFLFKVKSLLFLASV